MSSVDTKTKSSEMTKEQFYAERGRGNVMWLLIVAGVTLLIMVTAFMSRMM